MSERTDELSSGSGSEDADLDELLDDDLGGSDAGGDVGASDLDSSDAGLDDEEIGVDMESLTGEPAAESSSPSGDSSSGILSRLIPSFDVPNPLDAVPSARSFILSFLAVVVPAAIVNSIPVLGWIPASGVVGIVAGAFALGLASGERRYVELGFAGAALTAYSFTWGFFRLAIISQLGFLPFAVLGGVIGLVAAALGHYFGRDFRSGLTRDIE